MNRIGLLGLVAILLSWASSSPAGDFKVYPGAKDMMTSKQWARIQRPMMGMDMKEGPDRTYIVLSEKK